MTSDPAVLAIPIEQNHLLPNVVFMYNFLIHVQLMGGEDSDNPRCLYKAHGEAVSALVEFEASLGRVASLW